MYTSYTCVTGCHIENAVFLEEDNIKLMIHPSFKLKFSLCRGDYSEQNNTIRTTEEKNKSIRRDKAG